MPQTITAIYRAIEESLWKKDILRLKKEMENKLVTKDNINNIDIDQIVGTAIGARVESVCSCNNFV